MKLSRKTLMSVLAGVIIGSAGIIPGASGGILAVALGVYHEALDAIAGLMRDFKRNFLFLLPYGIGVAIGLLITAWLLEWLLKNWHMPLMYLLIGMVLGGVPSLLRAADTKGFHIKYLLCVLIGAALVAVFALLDGDPTGSKAWELTYLTAALAGGIISVGVVIPGVSTSFILMYMGLYEPLLAAFTRFDFPVLLCAAFGGLAVSALLIKLVRQMFALHPAGANFCILGFLLGTTVLIFPGIAPLPELLFYIALMAAGFVSTVLLEKFDK